MKNVPEYSAGPLIKTKQVANVRRFVSASKGFGN
jgi:hypothetical protein